MPAGALPPTVVSGQPIASSWGNAVVDNLKWAAVNRGSGQLPAQVMINGATILHQAVPAVAYATFMRCWANAWCASDSGNIDGGNIRVQTQQGPASDYQTPSTGGATPGRYIHIGVGHTWAVPANSSPQFSLSVGWVTTSGGTTYVAATVLWEQIRQ